MNWQEGHRTIWKDPSRWKRFPLDPLQMGQSTSSISKSIFNSCNPHCPLNFLKNWSNLRGRVGILEKFYSGTFSCWLQKMKNPICDDYLRLMLPLPSQITAFVKLWRYPYPTGSPNFFTPSGREQKDWVSRIRSTSPRSACKVSNASISIVARSPGIPWGYRKTESIL